MPDNNAQYLGNPNLKKANVAQNFTKKQVAEFLKCAQDPVYFAKNYVQIINLDEGLVPFEMYDFQEKLVNNFHNNRFNICKMPRQSGKSTTVVSYLLHYAIFNDSVTIGILANKARLQEIYLVDYRLHMRTYPSGCNRVSLHGTKDLWNWKTNPRSLRHLPLHQLFEVCHSTLYS